MFTHHSGKLNSNWSITAFSSLIFTYICCCRSCLSICLYQQYFDLAFISLFCGKVCVNRQLRWRLFCSAFLHTLFREYCFLQKVNIFISLFVSKYIVSVHMWMTCTPKDLCMKYIHRTANGGGGDAHFEINVFVYVRERHSDRWCFRGRPYQQPLLQKMWSACLGYTSQVWNHLPYWKAINFFFFS